MTHKYLFDITNNADIKGKLNPNDEWFTPVYAVKPILRHIKPNSKIWCPFDESHSNFNKVLSSNEHEVICTHITNGTDFFTADVPEVDYIISNPPYSKRNDLFERLFEIGKPFAMLISETALFHSKRRFEMFSKNEFELLYFDKRIGYFKEQENSLKPSAAPFLSVFVTSGMLESKMIFQEIDKNDNQL